MTQDTCITRIGPQPLRNFYLSPPFAFRILWLKIRASSRNSCSCARSKIDLDVSGPLRASAQISHPCPLLVSRFKRPPGFEHPCRVYPATPESPVRPWNRPLAVWGFLKTVPPVQPCPGEMHHTVHLSATPQPTASAPRCEDNYANLSVEVR